MYIKTTVIISEQTQIIQEINYVIMLLKYQVLNHKGNWMGKFVINFGLNKETMTSGI